MNIAGIGTEIVECLRVAQMIERHGEQFLHRVFTPAEIEFCRARSASTQHFAACWAAKEAVLKSLGAAWSRGINFRDIEIRQGMGRPPRVALAGGARDACEQARIGEVHLSLAFCRTHATAYALSTRAENGSE